MCKMCASSDDSSVMEAPPPKPAPAVSKNLERFKNKHNIVTDPNNEEKQKEVEYQPDLLAVSTQYTKVAYDLFRTVVDRMQDSKAYAVATKTSQPFHVAFGVIVLLVWLMKSSPDASVRGWKALYVGSMATHFGAQVWMTLISGIVLYFNLPRHEFGRVQTVLFPVYYTFNASLSLLALISYFKIQCLTRFAHTSWVQFALLSAVMSIEIYVRVSLVRPMLRAKHAKTQMEEVAGGGQEVGRLLLGELAHCPRYIRVLKTFRMYHSSIAMGTLIGLGCSLYSIMILVDSMCF